jgi:hypothetical protein
VGLERQSSVLDVPNGSASRPSLANREVRVLPVRRQNSPSRTRQGAGSRRDEPAGTADGTTRNPGRAERTSAGSGSLPAAVTTTAVPRSTSVPQAAVVASTVFLMEL